jgi:hypothetical protein
LEQSDWSAHGVGGPLIPGLSIADKRVDPVKPSGRVARVPK